MPLSLATEPLTKIFHTRPPVSFTRPVRTKNILADKIQLFDVSAEFKSQDHAKTMRNLMKSEEEDSYGEECWYSGSCVRVVEDLVIFSGNDGSLKVAKLLEDERKVFNKVPGDVAQISDKKLEFSRILSLDIQNEGRGRILVGARHRWWVGLFFISEVVAQFICRWCLPGIVAQLSSFLLPTYSLFVFCVIVGPFFYLDYIDVAFFVVEIIRRFGRG